MDHGHTPRGLGIGANTAVFSVINGVLLKPLPYDHSDRLVLVRQSAPLSGQATVGVAIAEYVDDRDHAEVFGCRGHRDRPTCQRRRGAVR